jgi:tetraacyldisaccharide 4'-kinase
MALRRDHRSAIERFFLKGWLPGGPGWFVAVMAPFALLFGGLTAFRRWWYASPLASIHRVRVPVIVIGNISVGGTGKTPLTMAVCQHLERVGRRPAIVLRGYGRQRAGGASDEELLLRKRTGRTVVADADRTAAARGVLAMDPAARTIVADDGLQHYRLHRDLEIAVIDGERGFGNGWLLPAGPLREPVARLVSVDAIVIQGDAVKPIPDHMEGDLPARVPCFMMQLSANAFVNVATGQRLGLAEFARLHPGRGHAVAGIGNPERFFSRLRDLNLDTFNHAFPDHHAFSSRDLAFLKDDDWLVLTEKDAVRLGVLAQSNYWYLEVDAILPPHFFLWLDQALESVNG